MFGRAEELARIERLVRDVRDGASGCLVVRGEAGIGKSTLLARAGQSADGLRVLRGVGIESESELPFAALHLLLRRDLDRIDALPSPQAAALRGALGLSSEVRQDRFVVGLAVLSLLTDLAEDAPLLCLIDDAQWLDHATADALLFTARRLGSESIALVFAARDGEVAFPAPGLPELTLTGLPPDAAADLLTERRAHLPPPVRDRILHDAAGNPLALIELPEPAPYHPHTPPPPPPAHNANSPDAHTPGGPSAHAPGSLSAKTPASSEPHAPSAPPTDSPNTPAAHTLGGRAAHAAGGSVAEGAGGLVARSAGGPNARTRDIVAARDPDGSGAGSVGERVAASGVHDAFLRRIQALPGRTRDLLTVLAADATGDLELVLRAAAPIGISRDDLLPAEEARLIRWTASGVAFRHPLMRTAAYRGAPLEGRLAAHRALAHALAGAGAEDQRAWHLAASAYGHDSEAATALDRAAERAGARAAHGAAATAYRRAAELTASGDERGRRLAKAAHSTAMSGDPAGAAALATSAERLLADPVEKARLAPLHAAVDLVRGSPWAAGRTLLAAAATVDDASVAVPLLMEAARHAWFCADRLLIAEAADRVAAFGPSVQGQAAWLSGLAAMAAGDLAGGLPRILEAAGQPGGMPGHLDATSGHSGSESGRSGGAAGCLGVGGARAGPYTGAGLGDPQTRMMAAFAAHRAGADAAALEMMEPVLADLRVRGALDLLPQALQFTAQVELFEGRHGQARMLIAEAVRLARDVGQGHWNALFAGVLARVAAIEGDAEAVRRQAAELRRASGGSPAIDAWGDAALGLLDLGEGRYEAALERLDPVVSGPGHNSLGALFALPDHVEAAARTGRPDLADGSLVRFAEYAAHCRQPWARAVALRCRALSGADGEAGALYAEAVDAHADGGRPLEAARTRLLYGEWLRRARRRAEAGRMLRAALAEFERLGAAGWAGRARTELGASGGPREAVPPVPLDDPLAVLTPQERQIVQLAATGLSNRQIGARLFLSHRTVGYHLYKAFPKLGLTSRSELARVCEPS